MKPLIVIATILLINSAAHAEILRNDLNVYPAVIQRGSPLLILVESAWSSGCQGTLSIRATPELIEVLADESASANRICTAVIVPFQQLFNPRAALAGGLNFAESFSVRYTKRPRVGQDYVESETIRFSNLAAEPFKLEPGSFVTDQLSSSNLAIDQRGAVVTTNLSDYDVGGRGTWFFGSGKLNGNVYISEPASYRTIQCIRAPCPRAAPDQSGNMLMLIRDQNTLLVNYQNMLSGPQAALATLQYRRFNFLPNSNLPSAEAVGFSLPDLEGRWLAGVLASGAREAALSEVTIRYVGRLLADPSAGSRFQAFARDRSGNERPSFAIDCKDQRPVDGPIACSLSNFSYQNSRCDASFDPQAVGPSRLDASASCGGANDSFETRFVLRRL